MCYSYFQVTVFSQIRVGMIVAENVEPTAIGYSTSGGAIAVALDRVRNESLLNGYNFTLVLSILMQSFKCMNHAISYPDSSLKQSIVMHPKQWAHLSK